MDENEYRINKADTYVYFLATEIILLKSGDTILI
jgi:hypothetical protein